MLAIAAFTYSEILTEPDMILSYPYQWAERLPQWLFKLLIDCSKCVAGQWALWLFPFYISTQYDAIVHAWFVLQCIFNTVIVRAIYYRITGTERTTTKPVKPTYDPPELKQKKNAIENY